MSKVSIIIPARAEKEENLTRTLDSIYNNASGEIEVIIGFNGEPFYELSQKKEILKLADNDFEVSKTNFEYPNLKIVKFPHNIGIKGNINTLALLATGKYLFKLDAHTRVGNNFDEILKKDMQEDWIVMPRFKIIKEDWSLQVRDGEEEFYDYFFLSCPFTDPKGLRFKAGGHWSERTKERLKSHPTIDETPQIHGSGWFMTKDRFFELGGFPLQDPYGHGQEPLWLALRNWIEGGKVMVNKSTWYAHLHQDPGRRGYSENKEETEKTYRITADYWLKEPGFTWFLEKFLPMPSWPEDWRELLNEYNRFSS